MENLSVTKIVNSIIDKAIKERAVFIHIEPYDKYAQIRLRIDGILVDDGHIPKKKYAEVISRIKSTANLQTNERRVPQDGRFKITHDGETYILMVATIPALDGEKLAIRIIHESLVAPTLESLGYWGTQLELIKESMAESSGFIILAGPNDSGRSTSLFSILSQLDSDNVHIGTIENPIEYRIQKASQTQIDPRVHLTYANALRALFKQDNNVIMINELSDSESATLAFEAASSGRLVFSTLYSTDSSLAVSRLANIGLEPAMIAQSLRLVTCQRLARKLCSKCKQAFEPDNTVINQIENLYDIDSSSKLRQINQLEKKLLASLKRSNTSKDLSTTDKKVRRLYKAKDGGCKHCNNKGYEGRIVLFEALRISSSIQKLIVGRASSEVIHATAIQEGMIPLKIDGLVKALCGFTTIDEVVRVSAGTLS